MAAVAGTKIISDGLVLNFDAANLKSYQPGDLKWKDLNDTYRKQLDYTVLHTLDNPNAFGTDSGDGFGGNLAVSDTYLIVGTPSEDSSDGASVGVAYIFDLSTGALLHTLFNPNGVAQVGDLFGTSVDITDNYAIVGANEFGDREGKAYIFNPSTGALLHTIDNPATQPSGDYFGRSVGIVDNYAIVGAHQDSNSGKAYIFNPSTGALLHTLNNPNIVSSSFDRFGYSVAISNSYAIVGAYEEDLNGNDAGVAYIYDNATGNLLHVLANPFLDSSTLQDFGHSVDISDKYAVVQAKGKLVHVFDVVTGNLLKTFTKNQSSNADKIYISGDNVIVGASLADDVGTNSGLVYIYDVIVGNTMRIITPSTGFGSRFGSGVAINDNYMVIGADNVSGSDGSGSGQVLIYSLTENFDYPDATPTTSISFNNNGPLSSFSFTGSTTDYLTISDNSLITGKDSYTIDVWARISTQTYSGSDGNSIFTLGINPQNNDGDYGIIIDNRFSNSKTLEFRAASRNPPAELIFNSSSDIFDRWLNIVGVQDGGFATLYLNTEQVGQNGSSIFEPVIPGDRPLVIGYGFTGEVSNIKVYNKALTTDEIAQNFEALRGRYGI